MTLASVPWPLVEAVWPRVEPWLARVCAQPESDCTLPMLRDLCLREEGLLIMIFDQASEPVAAGVMQVREANDGARSCWVLAVGGSGARGWRGTLAQIEAGAALEGCGAVEFVGRHGWSRLLPDYRAEPCERGIHYSKSLVH